MYPHPGIEPDEMIQMRVRKKEETDPQKPCMGKMVIAAVYKKSVGKIQRLYI